MTKEKLTQIVQFTELDKIIAELLRLGYRSCEEDCKYAALSLIDIYNGDCIETERYENVQSKLSFGGEIYTNVKGAEELEIISIVVNDKKSSLPLNIEFYIKEIKETP